MTNADLEKSQVCGKRRTVYMDTTDNRQQQAAKRLMELAADDSSTTLLIITDRSSMKFIQSLTMPRYDLRLGFVFIDEFGLLASSGRFTPSKCWLVAKGLINVGLSADPPFILPTGYNNRPRVLGTETATGRVVLSDDDSLMLTALDLQNSTYVPQAAEIAPFAREEANDTDENPGRILPHPSDIVRRNANERFGAAKQAQIQKALDAYIKRKSEVDLRRKPLIDVRIVLSRHRALVHTRTPAHPLTLIDHAPRGSPSPTRDWRPGSSWSL